MKTAYVEQRDGGYGIKGTRISLDFLFYSMEPTTIEGWCRRWESNPHDLTVTGFKNVAEVPRSLTKRYEQYLRAWPSSRYRFGWLHINT